MKESDFSRVRAMIHVIVLFVALSVLTCCQILVYDMTKKWNRPFRSFAYTGIMWLFPLFLVADICWVFRARLIGEVLCAYILTELTVIFHKEVIYNWWIPHSRQVAIFIHFALIQSVLKILCMLVASARSRTGTGLTAVCAATGILSATFYSIFPLVKGGLYTVSWSFIGETTLLQSLNLVLGVLTGLFIFRSGRFLGGLIALAFDAPIIGASMWISLSVRNLTALYQSLLILGVIVLTSAMYYTAVRRPKLDRNPSADQIPVFAMRPVVVVS